MNLDEQFENLDNALWELRQHLESLNAPAELQEDLLNLSRCLGGITFNHSDWILGPDEDQLKERAS